MDRFEINSVRAVGMHHHGPPDLILEEHYLKWEPENPKDLGNAVAIYDHHGKRRAYLTRDDAKIISDLYYGDCVNGYIICKPYVQGHVVCHTLGPQQECQLIFTAKNTELDFVHAILKSGNVQYVCK